MFPQMTKVAIGPTRTNSTVCRLVEFEDGSARVETWRKGAWVPGRAAKASVAKGPPACADLLARLGVPPMPGEPKHDPEPLRVYAAKLRLNLMCRRTFESAWAGERICRKCKGGDQFAVAAALSDQFL
jgi:hypothetical protein